jgi:hypothetical protein
VTDVTSPPRPSQGQRQRNEIVNKSDPHAPFFAPQPTFPWISHSTKSPLFLSTMKTKWIL